MAAFTAGPASANFTSSAGEMPSISHSAAAPYGMSFTFSHEKPMPRAQKI